MALKRKWWRSNLDLVRTQKIKTEWFRQNTIIAREARKKWKQFDK
jgi:hypothetical protein